MILATHAIVGAAIASQVPNHPVIALLAGIASHFAIDAIPHWDYPLRSIRSGAKKEKGSPLTLDKGFLVDLSLIALDGLAGLTLAFSLFAQPGSLLTILLGALGGMLPDPLRFVHRLWFSGFITGYMQNKNSLGRSASLLSSLSTLRSYC